MKRASWLFWTVLGASLGRHCVVDVLAMFYADPERARRALFYVAGGLQAALLYALIWALMPRAPRVIYVSTALACAWGILEELQVAGCRLAAGIEARVSAPMWRGLCDAATDLPISTITLAVPLVLVLWLYGTRE